MKGPVITFVPDRGRKPPKETPGEASTIVLPVIRIERPEPEFGTGGEETIGSLLRRKRHAEGPPGPKLKRATIASRRAMKELDEDAGTVEACLGWLAEVASHGHDPRAIAEMIEHWDTHQEFNPLRSREQCEQLGIFFAAVLGEYSRRFPRAKPKLVTDEDKK